MSGAHAILSASGAARWMACPPSALLEAAEPDTTSEYAEEGSFAHLLAERDLRKALGERVRRPRGYQNSPYYSEVMEDALETYITLVMERVSAHKATTPDPVILFEQRLDFSRWVPEGYGTGDVVIISDLGIEVIDLKYGKGIPVSAEDNPQLRLYGLGALNSYGMLYDASTILMTIVQPRLDSISTETLKAEELIEWAETYVRPRAALAWEGKGEFTAGEHCQFCKLRATCRARAEANLELAKADFALQDPPTLSVEEIGEVLARADELVRWANDVKAYAQEQAEKHGVKFPGWKLVEGRSIRKYADEDSVAAIVLAEGYAEADIYERKLAGITKLEQLLGKKRFSELLGDLIIKPAGKPTLVPESDKRPEIGSAQAAAADFGEGVA